MILAGGGAPPERRRSNLVFCHDIGQPCPETWPYPFPEGCDFELCFGPASKRQFYANRFYYNWHWFWDTGNGDIGSQCVLDRRQHHQGYLLDEVVENLQLP